MIPVEASMYDHYRVSVEALENGFAVEVPDMEAVAKKRAAGKKKGGDMPTYFGDCTKKFAARSVKEAVRLVSQALEKMPDAEYDVAFDEAAGKK